MEQRLYMLDSKPVLEGLVMPLTTAELEVLKEKIDRLGGAIGVRVWNNTILVDYEYYYYCHTHSLPFCLIDIPLNSKAEAVMWVCRNQLERKTLSGERRKYLIGRLSLAEREYNLLHFKLLGVSTGQQELSLMKLAHYNSLKTVVRERIGREYNLVYMTVRKYEAYAAALDKMRDVCLGFVNEHLDGRLRMSIERIESLASLPAQELYTACQRWLQEPDEVKLGRRRRPDSGPPQEKKNELRPAVSVKDMPVYDPDAEIISLVFTIPSWRSTIRRLQDVIDVDTTSREARLRLIEALLLLQVSADKLIDVLREETDEEL